jgi:uncharacterized protein (DUF58 family)
VIDPLDRFVLARPRGTGHPLSAPSGARLGSGIDFADYRRYAPGDDLRHVDFPVYARTRKLFVRRFHADSDLSLYLLLDTSGSMGLSKKLSFGSRIASALARVAARESHAIAFATFSDHIETYLAPSKRRGHLGRVLRSLSEVSAGGPSDLAGAFRDMTRRALRPGLAVILSDLFVPQATSDALSILRQARFEVAVLPIESPGDAAPEIEGEAEIWDVEGAVENRLRAGPRAIERYRKRFQEWSGALREQCVRRGVLCQRLSTSLSLSQALERLVLAGLLDLRRI